MTTAVATWVRKFKERRKERLRTLTIRRALRDLSPVEKEELSLTVPIPLDRAHLCVEADCNHIFDCRGQKTCPRCGSQHSYPVIRLVDKTPFDFPSGEIADVLQFTSAAAS